MDDGVAAARHWLTLDPDPANRAELEALLDAGDAAALDDRFGGRLRFGTAGLRGRLGPGPNRMNQVTVARVALALLRWRPGATVVIGFDARHGSRAFASVTARAVRRSGGTAVLLDEIVPTPVLAFAVRDVGADIGVMVTASHNPPADNGYKVYRADGAQLIAPADAEIEAVMQAIDDHDVAELLADDAPVGTASAAEMVQRYLSAVVPPVDVGRPVVAYTPLHGVGADVFEQALAPLGATLHTVASQGAPDPDFPTVAFPNPEEPGALDELSALADAVDADVALAHDPDADRLAVALPLDDGWEVLTGDEIGAVLADHLLATTTGDDRLVVPTVVSSRLLSHLARAAGVDFAETLTGFKWVMRPAIDGAGTFVFGYEEALGFAVNERVRDKDGISAGVTFLAALERLRRAGLTPRQRLDELACAHGAHVGAQRTIAFTGSDAGARMAESMDRVRSSGWVEIGTVRVAEVVDFADGSHDPGTDLLRFDLDDGSRIQVRPSGTEPKLKIYGEVVVPVDAVADVPAARFTGAAHCDALLADAAARLA